MKTKYTTPIFCIIFLLSAIFSLTSKAQENTPLPPGWDFQSTSSNPHGLIIMLEANPRINDISLQPGDYIGAFYIDDDGEQKCGGADFLLSDENIIFTIFGDDNETPLKDGFGFGEEMHFKVFSWVTQKEYDVDLIDWDPDYATTNKWYPLGLSAVTNLISYVEFDAYASAVQNPVCIGNAVSLEANIFQGTTGNYTYLWSSIPAGFTSTLQYPNHTPIITTTYQLVVNDGILTSSHELVVVVNEPPTVDAGEDITICPAGCAELNPTVQNYSGIIWETTGDGTFNNPELQNPVYIPGSNDIEVGNIELSTTVNPLLACTVYASDNVNVVILPIPTIGISNEIEYCNNQDIILDPNIENYSAIAWTTDGDGTFENPNTETTQYFPGPNDLAQQEFSLHICAAAIEPLPGEVCWQILVTTFEPPTVNAPGSRTKCDNIPVPLNSVAYNYNSILWTTEGDGTFENPESLNTFYYTGESDKANGGTTVSVNAFGFGACEVFPATKNTTINLNPSPTVNAGNETVLCSGNYLQLNASAENYAGLMWVTSGDGFFTNMNITNPTYIPGVNDNTNGSFTVTLTAYPLSPCTASVNDELYITIVEEPTVEILTEDNQNYPMGQVLELSTESNNYESILWETTGDGSFDNPQSPNPGYTPGSVTDASGEPITLSVTAFAATNCGNNVSDLITATFSIQATVYAGIDIITCDEPVSLMANSQFCESVLWETNGDGTFNDLTSLSPTYNPGQNDISTGMVELCITGTYGENLTVSDCLNISIATNPVINFGFDQVDVCFNETVPLELISATNYSSILWYTTNGGGYFNNNGNTSTTYIPSPSVDYTQGCIHIFALAQPIAPCSIVSEEIVDICFINNPEADAGEDFTITENDTFFLSPIVNGQSEVVWQTSGDGTFSNTSALSPEYFPGEEDIANGEAELTIIAYPSATCITPAFDFLTVTIYRVHSIVIPEGWSGFSSYVGNNTDFEIALESVADQLMIAQTMSGIYWPEGGINTIGNFSNATGYKIKMTESIILNLTGPATSVSTVELTQGWNLIPVLSSNYINYNDIISQLGDNLIVMKEIAGNGIIWPEMGIYNIPVLKPGSAYIIAVNENTSITFDEFGEMKNGIVDTYPNDENNSPWIVTERTTITHSVAFAQNSLGNLSNGDYIAAFNENNICVGLTEISNQNQNIALTIFGDENLTPNIEGMIIGEKIHFKVYKESTDEIIPVSVAFNTTFLSSDGLFTENGLSVVERITIKSTSVSETMANNVSVYPNPCKGKLTFSAENVFSSYTISISDLNGRPILEENLSGQTQIDLSVYPKGFYIVVINGDNYRKIEKLILK